MNSNNPALITAALVPESKRLTFLPRHFGRLMLTVEREVFSQMRALCAEYSGGLWAFYELSNGGAFLAPTESVPMMIRVHTNDFVGTMGAQAAGITVTLFALSILALRYRDNERLSECFHQLRDFAIEHTEAAAIFAAID